MAAIIHAPALSGHSRQLRRPGVAAPAGADAVAPLGAVAPVDAVKADSASAFAMADAVGAPAAVGAAAAPEAGDVAAPVDAAASLDAAAPSAAAEREEQLALGERRLREDAQLLRREQAALKADADALAQQRAALAEREQQLASARQALADEAEEIRAQAESRGHAAGLERGERAAGEAVSAQVERVGALVQALTQARRALLEENQDMLVEIVFAATCRMLGRHAATRAGIESMVLALIENERELDKLTVRLHPQDALRLGETGAALDPRVAIEADASVELGGCLVDSGRGTLDARLDRQLRHLREALTSVRNERGQFEVPV